MLIFALSYLFYEKEKLMPISLNSKKRYTLLAFVALLSLAAAASAQENSPSNIKIKNFGQMDERFYRGAQPKEQDYKDLAQLGIRTVIDLRDDPEPYEKPMVESLGMTYIHIPMNDKKYPTAGALDLFLKTVNDPNTGKFFVHCAGGRDRTGLLVALLLDAAGVEREAIAADHALSDESWGPRNEAWFAEAPTEAERQRRIRIAVPAGRTMVDVLEEVDRRYGGTAEYLATESLDTIVLRLRG